MFRHSKYRTAFDACIRKAERQRQGKIIDVARKPLHDKGLRRPGQIGIPLAK
jgi:hypothetical protein